MSSDSYDDVMVGIDSTPMTLATMWPTSASADQQLATQSRVAGGDSAGVWLAVVGAIGVLGVALNVLCLIAMCRARRSHSMIGHFLASLAVSDIVVALSTSGPVLWAALFAADSAESSSSGGPFGELGCTLISYVHLAM